MIYTPQWAALPAPLKQEVYSELAAALKPDGPKDWAYLPVPEKQAIVSILSKTLEDLPPGWPAPGK